MKMYKKSDLNLIDGMLVNADGDIVGVDREIVRQANELETINQKAAYLADQPAGTPMPSLDGFERVSVNDDVIESMQFKAHTPVMDLEAMRTMALMDEIDDVDTVGKANELLAKFDKLIEFVNADYVIDCDIHVTKFDTPTLGSVLDLTKDVIAEVVGSAVGLEKGSNCEECDDIDCPSNPAYGQNKGKVKIKEMTEEEFDKLLDFLGDVENGDDETEDTEE